MKKDDVKDIIDEIIYETIVGKNPFEVGDLVKLGPDVLNGVGPKVSWRTTLQNLLNKTGKITRVFTNSKHVSVQFPNSWKSKNDHGETYVVDTIGIDYTNLIPAHNPEKEMEEGVGHAYTKDIKKDPHHTVNNITGKVQRWTVKYDENINISEIKKVVKDLLKEMWTGFEQKDIKEEESNLPPQNDTTSKQTVSHPRRNYVIWGKSGPATVYYVSSDTQGERMVQNAQSIATRFTSEESVRHKIIDLKKRYPGIKKWDFEMVGQKPSTPLERNSIGPLRLNIGHQVTKPTRNNETGEWVVKYFINGKKDENRCYYTDDRKDANDTYELMLYNAQSENRKAGK